MKIPRNIILLMTVLIIILFLALGCIAWIIALNCIILIFIALLLLNLVLLQWLSCYYCIFVVSSFWIYDTTTAIVTIIASKIFYFLFATLVLQCIQHGLFSLYLPCLIIWYYAVIANTFPRLLITIMQQKINHNVNHV